MSDQLWSWALTIVGATCFFLAGGLGTRKVWWAWYIGLFAQVLWLTYSLLDLEHRLGFLVGVALYGFVYVRNCVKWTREHLAGRDRGREVLEHWRHHDEREQALREGMVRYLADRIEHRMREQYFMPTTRVQLVEPDLMLRERHNVIPNETIGKVIDWSRLGENDFGVLVDWGDGETVRAEVHELRTVDPLAVPMTPELVAAFGGRCRYTWPNSTMTPAAHRRHRCEHYGEHDTHICGKSWVKREAETEIPGARWDG